MSRTVILSRGMLLAIGSMALCVVSSAGAQENLDKNKTGAQLYASNCAACHKSPQSVTKTTGGLGLESFLREHYPATPEAAAMIAAYLKGLGKRSAGSPHVSHRQAHEPGEALQAAAKRIQRGQISPGHAQRALKRLLQTIKPENN